MMGGAIARPPCANSQHGYHSGYQKQTGSAAIWSKTLAVATGITLIIFVAHQFLTRLRRRITSQASHAQDADVASLMERGERFEQDRSYTEALSAFNQILLLEPNNAAAHYHSGLVLAELGQLPTAITCFSRAIELNHQDPAAYYDRAWAYLRAGNKPQALADLQQAFELEPGLQEVARIDDHFEPFADDPDFKKLVGLE